MPNKLADFSKLTPTLALAKPPNFGDFPLCLGIYTFVARKMSDSNKPEAPVTNYIQKWANDLCFRRLMGSTDQVDPSCF